MTYIQTTIEKTGYDKVHVTGHMTLDFSVEILCGPSIIWLCSISANLLLFFDIHLYLLMLPIVSFTSVPHTS